MTKCSSHRGTLSMSKCLIIYHFVLCAWCCFTNHFRRLYIYIRLKIKPNSVRIRFQSRQICVLPSTGFEPTLLIYCSTIRLALRPAPQTTRLHPLPYICIQIHNNKVKHKQNMNVLCQIYGYTFEFSPYIYHVIYRNIIIFNKFGNILTNTVFPNSFDLFII